MQNGYTKADDNPIESQVHARPKAPVCVALMTTSKSDSAPGAQLHLMLPGCDVAIGRMTDVDGQIALIDKDDDPTGCGAVKSLCTVDQ
jgi:hypothetical protein